MMTEQAEVLSYHNGIAVVQCFAKSGCGSCHARSACGTKALSALSGEKSAPTFELAVDMPLNVGERVLIGLAEQTLLAGVFWIYGLPLLTVILSALGFSHYIENELAVAALVCLCTALCFYGVKRRLARRQQSIFTPIFLGKMPVTH